MTEVGYGPLTPCLDGDWRIWQRLEDQRSLCVIPGP